MYLHSIWIGIDTGGTFTDITASDIETGSYWFHKTPTTPDDASRGILQGLREILALAGVDPTDVKFVCHGTTLATNAVLERKWARTGMITTAGFRDILELARQRRPSFFNLDVEKPTPPAIRAARLEVAERVDNLGNEITLLDEAGVSAAVGKLKQLGCDAIAVCFLHSYANPQHEQRAAKLVRDLWPEAYICTSSDVLSEFREYERFATTTVNASLLPIIDRYLERFERGVADIGIGNRPLIMQSNGGAASPDTVRKLPINTFFSGPAGGVIGAAILGTQAGVADVISFDMGGTSTDVALIKNGKPGKKSVREMGGFPVRTRTLDIHTIGAGGGSLAWVDPGGLLKVGPKSAGARPGPACYGRGGELPTVSDANMVLQRLNQKALLDGRMPVYPDRARKAIETLCKGLDLDLVQTSAGVLEIVNVNMMGAVRVISIEQGEDPRQFALMPFGGAGPLHACDVAAMLGIPRVFVPQRPGILSALGLLHAATRADFSLTQLTLANLDSIAFLNSGLTHLEKRAKDWLMAEQAGQTEVIYEWHADVRYFGQNFELAIALTSDQMDPVTLDALIERFHKAHDQVYGYKMPDRLVEIVNLRLGVTVARPAAPKIGEIPSSSKLEHALIEERSVWFVGQGFTPTPVFHRGRLPIEFAFRGPAIIEQMDATTVIPPYADIVLDPTGNIMIQLPTQVKTAC
jgi:N-methylhydantoinase A